MIDSLLLLIAVLLVACLILLAVLLARQSRSLRDLSEYDRARQKDLWDLGNRLMDDLDNRLDDTAQYVQNVDRSVVNTVNQLGQTQTGLMESVQRQLLLASRSQEERLDALRLENERQLTEMRRTVHDKLSDTLDKKLNDSFAQVSQRLESVYKSLGEMHTLAAGVGDLKKVLTNVKTRGIWGEMQLGNLIRQTLAPGQYDENVSVVPGAAERVEFALRLPDHSGGIVRLPVDSKFPQEDYIRLVEASQAGNAPETEAARKALLTRIKTEAKRIRDKYIAPPYTTDFAVMFLPIEGLYAEVMQDPTLPETIQRDLRVVIAGPGTFSAMLNALQMGFRTMAIEKRTTEVWHLLGEIKTDFSRFADMLETTKRRLEQAGESIDSAVSRTRSIRKKLVDVESEDFLPDSDPTDHLDA